MAAEHYPPSIVNRLKNTGSAIVPEGYYRSKLFIAPFSSNTLVAAAGPVLSLLERLCLSSSLPPVEQIRENIAHELYAFHSKLRATQYTPDLINIAYYLLSTAVDEILAKNYLRIYNSAPEFKSFAPLTNEDISPQQRFFELLNYFKERPNQYLDLIELIYFCLIAGFEGNYHLKADGRQSLDNHIEHLYQIIQQYRFNKPHRLFNENPMPKTIKKNYRMAIVGSLLAFGLIMAAFLTSQVILENKAKNVLFKHTQLALLDN